MKKNLLFAFTFYLTAAIQAQGSWTVYSTSNSGISSNNNWCVIPDKNNSIWVSTDANGVNKFDGSTWTSYTTSNSNIAINALLLLFLIIMKTCD